MKRVHIGAALAAAAIVATTWGVQAQQHQHGQPAAQAKPKATEEKKDPNRPKPENQPGATMDAEKLAASHADHHEMETYAGGGVLPAGWMNRFDLADMKLENMKFHEMPNMLHITTGPPGIFYQPTKTASGEYTIRGTFTQLTQGEHREGYGPIIGGADLDGAAQRYTYFLLRQDGKYLIKKRLGGNTVGVVDWTAHPAIKSFGANGKMTNELAIEVGATDVRFLINGTEVSKQPRAQVDTDGIVGLRVNHQLALEVANFGVQGKGTH